MNPEEKPKDKDKTVVTGVIEHSPDSARIILFGSATFAGDTALQLAMEATRTRYVAPVQLVENAIDWSLEDRGLLGIRGRGHFSRMLQPMERGDQMFWEYLNYGLALAGLMLVWGAQRKLKAKRHAHYLEIMNLRRVEA